MAAQIVASRLVLSSTELVNHQTAKLMVRQQTTLQSLGPYNYLNNIYKNRIINPM
jgi:hypothetical protein